PKCIIIVNIINPGAANVSPIDIVLKPVPVNVLTAVNNTSIKAINSFSLYTTGNIKIVVHKIIARKYNNNNNIAGDKRCIQYITERSSNISTTPYYPQSTR